MIRWGHQTDLAIGNFPISGEVMPLPIVRAIALIKVEAAQVNASRGVIDRAMADAIGRAGSEIIAGDLDDQFPIDVFQTGSGTSTNMNVNEVIAHRASELLGAPVHPNDHVNASQSSNDVFPSAIRIAAATAIDGDLLPALEGLERTLRSLADRHRDTVKLGRTHMMDAVPITFGQEASGWERAIHLAAERLAAVMSRLVELPIGGTAVGTGLNAPMGFGAEVARRLAERTGVDFIEAVNHFEAQAAQDVLLELSGVCKVVAISLHKVAGDLRLLGSGPDGGLGEIVLPALQAGSSIMPGKVNPVICEVVQQVTAQVVGNDATITFAATASTLQLNTAMPVMGRSVLSSVHLLTRSASVLADKCIAGIQVDPDRMRNFAESSSALATALAPRLGYDATARLVTIMRERSMTLAEALAAEGIDGAAEVDLLALTRPASPGSPTGDHDHEH